MRLGGVTFVQGFLEFGQGTETFRLMTVSDHHPLFSTVFISCERISNSLVGGGLDGVVDHEMSAVKRGDRHPSTVGIASVFPGFDFSRRILVSGKSCLATVT
jgi:hypothetical protein